MRSVWKLWGLETPSVREISLVKALYKITNFDPSIFVVKTKI